MTAERILLLLVLLMSGSVAAAQEADTLKTGSERRSNQNVMLNASYAAIPRTISLGIPEWGTYIMDDGLPASMFSNLFPGYLSWRSGLSTESMQLTRLDESAIQLGSTGFFPMSVSRTGADKTEGAVKYTANQYGRHVIELRTASPLGNGWGIDLNVYQSFDRGSNHLDFTTYQERTRFYKAGLSKKLPDGKSLFKATYLFMNYLDLTDQYGPFIFVGDGNVKPYGDFRLGRDQYIPETSFFEYVDLRDGKRKTGRYTEDLGIPVHVLTAGFTSTFGNGMEMDLSSRLRMSDSKQKSTYLNGITEVKAGDGYSYLDGTPYSGNVQSRFFMYEDDNFTEWLTTVKVKKSMNRHSTLAGANFWFNWTQASSMTSNFAYEAKKNPKALTYNGEVYYVHNTGAQFAEGFQSRLALFAQDDWRVSPKINIHYGIRAEYSGINGKAAHNLDGKENNSRYNGWSLVSPGVSLTPFRKNVFNGAATLIGYYNFNSNWGAEFDAIATLNHPNIGQYGDSSVPFEGAQPSYILRGGVNFKNKWLDFQSLLTYLKRTNSYEMGMWTHKLSHAAGGFPAGYNETVYVSSLYDMEVLGWTTDMILTPFKGFTFHGLFTFRIPRYQNYSFKPVFSDGYSEEYDFSGKRITSSSGTEIELEPSYETGKWRLWISARYYSRRYINITNTLFLSPRWETFGGVDFKWNEHVSLSLNVVNFLNVTGASAGIREASLATDITPYQNYLTSGSYIRPFTLEFSTLVKF